MVLFLNLPAPGNAAAIANATDVATTITVTVNATPAASTTVVSVAANGAPPTTCQAHP
jgi:hypothetical protein